MEIDIVVKKYRKAEYLPADRWLHPWPTLTNPSQSLPSHGLLISLILALKWTSIAVETKWEWAEWVSINVIDPPELKYI